MVVSDFYTAYTGYEGRHQYCWAHLLRDVQEVVEQHPDVPATTNAAERSLRPLVTSRKISGGARSARGTQTKMTLASLFGMWRLRGINPFDACQDLLASPQA